MQRYAKRIRFRHILWFFAYLFVTLPQILKNWNDEKELCHETGSGADAAGGCLCECKCGRSDLEERWLDSDIRVNGSIEGRIEKNGDIRKRGSIIGKIEQNGDVRIGGSIVGKIEKNGDIRKSGTIIGKVENLSDPRQAAVMYFFDFFAL